MATGRAIIIRSTYTSEDEHAIEMNTVSAIIILSTHTHISADETAMGMNTVSAEIKLSTDL